MHKRILRMCRNRRLYYDRESQSHEGGIPEALEEE